MFKKYFKMKKGLTLKKYIFNEKICIFSICFDKGNKTYNFPPIPHNLLKTMS